MPSHLTGPVIRCLQELRVDQQHQFQIRLALGHRPVVDARSVELQQHALPHDRKPEPFQVDHLPPLITPSRTEALRKKSRLTSNWSIFACSFSTPAGLTVASGTDSPENVAAMPSIAWRLPLGNHALRHTMLRRQLCQRLLAPDRLQRNTRLELTRIPFSA